MNKHSYEATIEVDDEKVKEFIKDLFGDTEEYAKKQKHFNNEKIKDALSFLNSRIEHDYVPQKLWDSIETIAATMYLYGFERAFEYYVKHEDIFNLDDDDKSK